MKEAETFALTNEPETTGAPFFFTVSELKHLWTGAQAPSTVKKLV